MRPIADFTNMVKHWQEFDESRMGIIIENLRRSDLPADVFPEEAQIPVSKRVLSKVIY